MASLIEVSEATKLQCAFDLQRRCISKACMAWETQSQTRLRRVCCTNDQSKEPQRPEDLPADWVFVAGTPGKPAHWLGPLTAFGYCRRIQESD